MDLLIEKRKFLQSYRTNTDFIEGIEVNTEDNSKTIKNKILKPKVSKKEKGAIGITKFNKFLAKMNKLFLLSFIFKPSND